MLDSGGCSTATPAEGSCDRVGAYLSVPCAAEYVFLRK
jgi:hypothetical protein